MERQRHRENREARGEKLDADTTLKLLRHFTQNYKYEPHARTKVKVKGSKSLDHIIWEP